MNLIKAIASEKLFKRPCHDDWIMESGKEIKYGDVCRGYIDIDTETGERETSVRLEELTEASPFLWFWSLLPVFFTKESILATDWEIYISEGR